MKLPRIVIEIRPRLQSCQVYYHANSSGHYSVDILPSTLTFKYDTWEDTLEFEALKLKPSLLNDLNTDQENIITFRLQINSFVASESENISSKYVPCIENGKPTQISCKCCNSNLLNGETLFNRILPLPSMDFNSGDLFCHTCCKEDFDSIHKTYPKIHDLLYGNYFFKVNSTLISDSTIFTVKDIIYCQKCRTLIGSKDSNSVKLWNCTAAFNCKSSKITPKDDFVSAIKSVISESLETMCKIILNRKTTTSSGSEYLLIWVMDKNLPLLISRDGFNNLQETNVVKLLYSYERSHTALVSQWEKDMNVHAIDIVEMMFIEGVDYLENSNGIFPKVFREANNMKLGYLGI